MGYQKVDNWAPQKVDPWTCIKGLQKGCQWVVQKVEKQEMKSDDTLELWLAEKMVEMTVNELVALKDIYPAVQQVAWLDHDKVALTALMMDLLSAEQMDSTDLLMVDLKVEMRDYNRAEKKDE